MALVKIGSLKGPKGDDGDVGTFASASAETVAPTAAAEAIIGGTPAASTVHFKIPQGVQGLPGTNGVPTAEAIAQNIELPGPVRDVMLDGFLSRELTRTTDDGKMLLHIIDEVAVARDTLRLEDVAGHGAPLLNFVHRGGAAGQAYAINIGNMPDAKSGFVGHQYSAAAPFMQIDNTDVSTSLFIRNTENQVMNPGGSGTGAFMQFMPFGQTQSLFFSDSLQWVNYTSKDILVRAMNPSIYGFGVQVDADKTGLNVTKNGTGAGNAVVVTNKGTGVGLFVGQALTGGSGSALHVYNAGSGAAFRIQGASSDVLRVHANGEIEQYGAGIGLVLRSPNGSRWRLTVNDAGAVSVAAA